MFFLKMLRYLLIILPMSILSLLFGCRDKKSAENKVPEDWPRFLDTASNGLHLQPLVLEDGYTFQSFYITPNQQQVYVVAAKARKQKETTRSHPSEPIPMDFRFLCLDQTGKTLYFKDYPNVTWGYGSFGMLENHFVVRILDYFLELDPSNFAILDKIPVHRSAYISWKETERTFDEHRDYYQAQFDKLYQNPQARWLEYSPKPEYLVWVDGPKGLRAAWGPVSYDDSLLDDLKKHFPPISLKINPMAVNDPTGNTHFSIQDGNNSITEAARISAGTEFSYPNYMERTTVQYELTLAGKTIRFSTSDKKRHALQLCFADNLYLCTEDGTAWVAYEETLYRVKL